MKKTPKKKTAQKKKRSRALRISLLILTAVIVIAAVAAIVFFLCDTGYEEALNNYISITYYQLAAPEKVLAVAPGEYWDYSKAEYGTALDEFIARLKNYNQSLANDFASIYGDDFRIQAQVSEKSIHLGKNMDLIRSYLSDKYGIPKDDIRRAYQLQLDFSVTGSLKQASMGSKEYCAILIRDTWYLTNANLDGEFTYISFLPDSF